MNLHGRSARARLAILALAVGLLLSTVGCTGTIYYGVGVGGPYGYPHGAGPYDGPIYGGGVVVGRPF